MALVVVFSGAFIGCKKTAGDNSSLALLLAGGGYRQTAKLIDTNTAPAAPASADSDGERVSISGDGGTIAMGSTMANKYAQTDNGTILIFRPVDDVWTQIAISSGGDSNMRQGTVALSDDGSVYAQGAFGYSSNTGKAFIETWDTNTSQYLYTEIGYGAASNDKYGYNVAISGDGRVAVVCAPGVSSSIGEARVFVNKTTGGWTYIQTISASDGAGGDTFGGAVSISRDGEIIVVGAPGKEQGATQDVGAVYVFNKSASDDTWGGDKSGHESQLLTASSAGEYDMFGHNVAISANGTLIAASGYNVESVVLFTTGIDGWEERSSAEPTGGFGGQLDSIALSEDGSVLAVGVSSYGTDLANQGAVFIFKGKDYIWKYRQTLVAEDAAEGDFLGQSISLSADGKIIVAGAPGCDIPANVDQGAAYVFTK